MTFAFPARIGYSRYDKATAISSYVPLGEVVIDLDIGEAYRDESGTIVSVNDSLTIPAELPVLVPAANTITYDNTITKLEVVPRWWRI